MFAKKGLMIDCSRNAVRTVKTVERLIDIMSALGYNTLMLYTEDTYEIEGEPRFGYLRGRYSREEIKHLDAYAAKKGIELIPCIQTLAHLNAIKRWYGGYFDVNDILLTDSDEVYTFIEKMLKTVSECFTSRTVHIGMDEAHMLGLGRHLDLHGYEERSSIMRRHLKRVAQIAEEQGLSPLIWGDMFRREIQSGEDGKACLPENVTPVYWDYYSIDKANYQKKMADYKAFAPSFWFAGGLWTWTGFLPHNDYSVRASRAAIESAAEAGTENVFFTLWGDNGAEASLFSVLPSIYYVSRLLDGEDDEEKIKRGFYEFTGIKYDDFMLLDLPEINATPENRNNHVNPEKYMLYTDLFLGIFDTTVAHERNEAYARAEAALATLSENPEYGYIFKSASSLCGALKIKNDLGKRTREAYNAHKAGSDDELSALITSYDALLAALEKFYRDFRTQWMTENKPFGFEVQDLRLGGLIGRTKHLKERLSALLNGEADVIDELEEEILDFYGSEVHTYDLCYNNHALSVSTSVV